MEEGMLQYNIIHGSNWPASKNRGGTDETSFGNVDQTGDAAPL